MVKLGHLLALCLALGPVLGSEHATGGAVGAGRAGVAGGSWDGSPSGGWDAWKNPSRTSWVQTQQLHESVSSPEMDSFAHRGLAMRPPWIILACKWLYDTAISCCWRPLQATLHPGARSDAEAALLMQERAPVHGPVPPWTEVVLPSEPTLGDLVVPHWKHETLKDAVEAARNKQRVYVRNGDHHWDGKINMQGASTSKKTPRTTNIVGEGDSRLWGRWSIPRQSQGSFVGVMCAHEAEGVGWPCIIIRGNPWLFDACQIRSAGAYAVMCAKKSRAVLRRCGVGGMGSGARRAINAVIVMDSSWCLLQLSEIEDTDYAHPGMRLMEYATGGLENCTLQRNGYGVAVDNTAKVYVRDCVFRDNDHAAFYAGWEAAEAEMDIQRCTVFGRVWHTVDRPGKLSEGNNRMVSSVHESLDEAAMHDDIYEAIQMVEQKKKLQERSASVNFRERADIDIDVGRPGRLREPPKVLQPMNSPAERNPSVGSVDDVPSKLPPEKVAFSLHRKRSVPDLRTDLSNLEKIDDFTSLTTANTPKYIYTPLMCNTPISNTPPLARTPPAEDLSPLQDRLARHDTPSLAPLNNPIPPVSHTPSAVSRPPTPPLQSPANPSNAPSLARTPVQSHTPATNATAAAFPLEIPEGYLEGSVKEVGERDDMQHD